MKPTTTSKVLGIDIGGANLKVAEASGASLACYFPMWTDFPRLANVLLELAQRLRSCTQSEYSRVAVTMTGEMADCFGTRREGVQFILQQVCAAFPQTEIQVYSVDGAWLLPDVASHAAWDIAASNWHALASWIVRMRQTQSYDVRLVIDIGSTTVDVIPTLAGRVATQARTDRQRLGLQQLVYTGVGRTPIAAVLQEIVVKGQRFPLVAETFATSDDAYVALELVSIEANSTVGEYHHAAKQDVNRAVADTADGRPRSVSSAQARLARMLGDDLERLQDGEVEELARQFIAAQAKKVAAAINGNCPPVEPSQSPVAVFSGHGRCLAVELHRYLDRPWQFVFLDELLTPVAARCAPAVAVAWLLENPECER